MDVSVNEKIAKILEKEDEFYELMAWLDLEEIGILRKTITLAITDCISDLYDMLYRTSKKVNY